MRTEFRQDPVTGRWVIVAPDRSSRPNRVERESPGKATVTDSPFAPGNEDQIPPIILELPSRNGLPWQTRVIPNKYPALTPDANTVSTGDGFYRAQPGRGRHEVVIEHPDPAQDLATMAETEVAAVIETYLRRHRALQQTEGGLIPFIFRNHGAQAGASLPHPHSQIVALPEAPPSMRHREAMAHRHYTDEGQCIYCTILERERQAGLRVVEDRGGFLTFVPYAAEVPFEMWIVPTHHAADFGTLLDARQTDLAATLQRALRRLRDGLGNPAYNYALHSASTPDDDTPHLHWYLRIVPRRTVPGGFEWGAGVAINPSSPEDDAAFLREQSVDA
ncbi:MAG: galactose-1-phosphate uridylyltransferase [Bacteroidetes bacterium]|jgi:UDPglucose--hexose-1-phosphate uridylyltransferase|nr:galactose-1-phosphate uridylyltransferase [Bacteroidota bacterium]